jgi:hypothetical protein
MAAKDTDFPHEQEKPDKQPGRRVDPPTAGTLDCNSSYLDVCGGPARASL